MKAPEVRDWPAGLDSQAALERAGIAALDLIRQLRELGMNEMSLAVEPIVAAIARAKQP